jgi:hypothetical protein
VEREWRIKGLRRDRKIPELKALALRNPVEELDRVPV